MSRANSGKDSGHWSPSSARQRQDTDRAGSNGISLSRYTLVNHSMSLVQASSGNDCPKGPFETDIDNISQTSPGETSEANRKQISLFPSRFREFSKEVSRFFRVINERDKNPAYGEAIAELKQEGTIPAELEHREAN